MELSTLFVIIICIHGVIHFFGFLKAFRLTSQEIGEFISERDGILWLITGLLFLFTAGLYIFDISWWWIIGIAAIIISQILLIIWWKDANFGTVANILILIPVIIGFSAWKFENTFKDDVRDGFSRTINSSEELIKVRDIEHLPAPVKRYLDYVGILNHPKVHSYQVIMEGQMREKGQDWFDFTSEQYNFINEPQRLFYMKATVKGLSTYGYHSYKNGEANMKIKVLSIYPVVDIRGENLKKAETVTLFNDMCVMAPSTLISSSIKWQYLDEYSVKAFFTHDDITISATLHFNNEGQLINFISDDRYAKENGRLIKRRFSTPVSEYRHINGYNLPTYGEAIWHYPEGEFIYGKFNIKEIKYNVNQIAG